MNKLYFGDNLHILREHIKDEAVDLIYLDPLAWVGRPRPTAMHDYSILMMLAAPTSKMKEEAVGLGFYKAEVYGPEYPIRRGGQILTIEGLMNGTERPVTRNYHSAAPHSSAHR